MTRQSKSLLHSLKYPRQLATSKMIAHAAQKLNPLTHPSTPMLIVLTRIRVLATPKRTTHATRDARSTTSAKMVRCNVPVVLHQEALLSMLQYPSNRSISGFFEMFSVLLKNIFLSALELFQKGALLGVLIILTPAGVLP